MFEFPLIRFDDKPWLEKLQNGEFYMKNSFHYQKKEAEDLARSDPFDGSIPFPDVNGVMKAISGKEITNERLIVLDRFIKCFYHCTSTDFILTDGGLWKLKLHEDMVKEFKSDSAMLIFAPSSLVKQIVKKCNQDQELVWWGDVQYFNYDDYPEIARTLLENPSEGYKVPFYKNSKFSRQKEFRICVSHPFEGMDDTAVYQEVPSSIIESSHTITIEPMEDACIISVENLLKNGVLLDIRNEHYYVCEESIDA